jgi:hypothetical protein
LVQPDFLYAASLLQLQEAGQRTFQYRGAKLWNSLESELENIPTISSFKKKIFRNILLCMQ